MSTASSVRYDESAIGETDSAAAIEHFATGRQIDPAIAERLRARAAQIRADVEHEHGLVDDKTFQLLLDEER